MPILRFLSAGGSAASRFVIVTGVIATTTAAAFQRLIYDPTGGTFTINAPPAPVAGDRFGVKNASSDLTGITISGNANNIEDPTASFTLAASFLLVGNGIGATWEFDGTSWLAV